MRRVHAPDLEELQPQRRTLHPSQIGAGKAGAKASSKRYELLFFKPIFHLPPSTVHLFVERLGNVRKIHHKKPWVLALCAMLGFGHHPAGAFRFRHPGYRQISGLAQAQAPAAGLFWASPSGQFRQFRESYIAFKIP